MTDQLEALRASIVDAVQQELTRFSQQVGAEVQRLRTELSTERDARLLAEAQVHALATAMQNLGPSGTEANEAFQRELVRSLEERLTEFSTSTSRRYDELSDRIGRVVDEANIGLAASVEAAARPMMEELEHRQDHVENDLKLLDRNLRKFDEQGARMVTHVNEITTAVERRLDDLGVQMTSDFDKRLAAIVIRLDEVSAAATRQQVDLTNLVADRAGRVEDRINDRILSLETRVKEEIGARVADIDAHVGRVTSTLDDTMATLSDRVAGVDSRVDEFKAELETVEERMRKVDADAIEDLKEKMSAAAGEAMLVRIEMERLDTKLGEEFDKAALRMTDIETALQDAVMDVDSAVQLDRLEEVERAIIALDPAQFVRRDELDGTAPKKKKASEETHDDSGSMPVVDLAGATSNWMPPPQ